MRVLLAGCVVALTSSTVASAQLVVPVSQSRTVIGDVSIDDISNFYTDNEQVDAPDFGVFDAAASATVDVGDAYGSGGAWQESEITGTSVRARGSAFANSECYDWIWLSTSYGWNDFVYEFTLTAPSDFVATGAVAAYDSGFAVFELEDSLGANVVATHALGPSESFDIDHAGTLAPGDYTLKLRASGDAYALGFEYSYGFAEFELDFKLTPAATPFCTAALNSTGSVGEISASGSSDIALNDFQLHADQLPQNKFGYFLLSASQGLTQPPNSQGNLCLGSPLGRFNAQVRNSGEQGAFWIPVDLTNVPMFGSVLSGETWNFTCWYRDNNPGSTSNFTGGLEVFFP